MEGSFRSSFGSTYYLLFDAVLYPILLFSNPPPTTDE